jgi:hypothetical protein
MYEALFGYFPGGIEDNHEISRQNSRYSDEAYWKNTNKLRILHPKSNSANKILCRKHISSILACMFVCGRYLSTVAVYRLTA